MPADISSADLNTSGRGTTTATAAAPRNLNRPDSSKGALGDRSNPNHLLKGAGPLSKANTEAGAMVQVYAPKGINKIIVQGQEFDVRANGTALIPAHGLEYAKGQGFTTEAPQVIANPRTGQVTLYAPKGKKEITAGGMTWVTKEDGSITVPGELSNILMGAGFTAKPNL